MENGFQNYYFKVEKLHRLALIPTSFFYLWAPWVCNHQQLRPSAVSINDSVEKKNPLVSISVLRRQKHSKKRLTSSSRTVKRPAKGWNCKPHRLSVPRDTSEGVGSHLQSGRFPGPFSNNNTEVWQTDRVPAWVMPAFTHWERLQKAQPVTLKKKKRKKEWSQPSVAMSCDSLSVSLLLSAFGDTVWVASLRDRDLCHRTPHRELLRAAGSALSSLMSFSAKHTRASINLHSFPSEKLSCRELSLSPFFYFFVFLPWIHILDFMTQVSVWAVRYMLLRQRTL